MKAKAVKGNLIIEDDAGRNFVGKNACGRIARYSNFCSEKWEDNLIAGLKNLTNDSSITNESEIIVFCERYPEYVILITERSYYFVKKYDNNNFCAFVMYEGIHDGCKLHFFRRQI